MKKSPITDLVKALKKDPDYRMAWEANIAMAFVDNANWHMRHCELKTLNKKNIRLAANLAAIYFLRSLCDEIKYPEGR